MTSGNLVPRPMAGMARAKQQAGCVKKTKQCIEWKIRLDPHCATTREMPLVFIMPLYLMNGFFNVPVPLNRTYHPYLNSFIDDAFFCNGCVYSVFV